MLQEKLHRFAVVLTSQLLERGVQPLHSPASKHRLDRRVGHETGEDTGYAQALPNTRQTENQARSPLQNYHARERASLLLREWTRYTGTDQEIVHALAIDTNHAITTAKP